MFVEKTKFCFPASECQYQDKAEGGGGGEGGRGVRVGEPLQCEWKGKRERGQLNKNLREEAWKVEIFFFLLPTKLAFWDKMCLQLVMSSFHMEHSTLALQAPQERGRKSVGSEVFATSRNC